MVFFLQLLQRVEVKLVEFTCSPGVDPNTGTIETNVVCTIVMENAYCDSSHEFCRTRDVARECAARKFIELLEEHGWDQNTINNLESRTPSPAPVLSDVTELIRSQSASPRGFSLSNMFRRKRY